MYGFYSRAAYDDARAVIVIQHFIVRKISGSNKSALTLDWRGASHSAAHSNLILLLR